jgi:hypothetical protein
MCIASHSFFFNRQTLCEKNLATNLTCSREYNRKITDFVKFDNIADLLCD